MFGSDSRRTTLFLLISVLISSVLIFSAGSAAAAPVNGEQVETVSSETGTSIGWQIPEQPAAQFRRATEPPAVEFESKTVENGAQTLIHINDSTAPDRYAFPVELPEGGRLELQEDGSVSLNVNGMPQGGFSTPWAHDGNGDELATHFEVEGSTLVQVVEFTENTQFPITADPRFEWGNISGHVWLNKEETRKATAITAGGGLAALPWLALVPPAFSVPIAYNVAAIGGWAVAAQAQGKCLALKLGVTGNTVPPTIGVSPEHHTGADCH